VIHFSLLGSGSCGNAILVKSRRTKVLIDSGLSFRQLRLRAAQVGETLDDLAGIFITHEHSDHVHGLGTLARKMNLPVYITRETYAQLPARTGELPRVVHFEAGDTVPLDGLDVCSFSVSHDAADPVSYVVHADGAKLGLAADLGHPSGLVKVRLAESHALVLESNHCPDLLRRSKYPPSVRQRIQGRSGHLSNGAMCSLLASLLHPGLRRVVLVHLSEENNHHDLALAMARQAVGESPVELSVASQDIPTPLYEVSP
jgi:phosphoribosyl 1,2-cyclic phosphodiesterase